MSFTVNISPLILTVFQFFLRKYKHFRDKCSTKFVKISSKSFQPLRRWSRTNDRHFNFTYLCILTTYSFKKRFLCIKIILRKYFSLHKTKNTNFCWSKNLKKMITIKNLFFNDLKCCKKYFQYLTLIHFWDNEKPLNIQLSRLL